MKRPVSEHRRQFMELLDGELKASDLTRATLLIACEEYDDLQPAHYLGHLQQLASRAIAQLATPIPIPTSREVAMEAIGLINNTLFAEEGLRGNDDDYYDPRNSFLNIVLDRRRGIPLSMSCVYMDVAGRLGLQVDGIGLPGHFLVGIHAADEMVFVDPYHQGRILSVADCRRLLRRLHGEQVVWRAEFLRPWKPREILIRMLYNLKSIYLRGGEFSKALWVQDLIILLQPGEPAEYRDRGLINAQLHRYASARKDLRQYLERSLNRPSDAEEVEKDLERLRRLHQMLN